jgi:biotin carboxyl carrier protein
MTARVIVNGKPILLALWRNADGWTFECNGKSGQAKVTQPERDVYHVLLDERSIEVRVSGDRMDVNGHELHVVLEDPRDAASETSAAGVQGRQSIAAPMPGKVVRVLVSEGDMVDQDQGIVVIEAMKMQNEMKSPKAGRVASLSAKEGSAVASGEILAVVE